MQGESTSGAASQFTRSALEAQSGPPFIFGGPLQTPGTSPWWSDRRAGPLKGLLSYSICSALLPGSRSTIARPMVPVASLQACLNSKQASSQMNMKSSIVLLPNSRSAMATTLSTYFFACIHEHNPRWYMFYLCLCLCHTLCTMHGSMLCGSTTVTGAASSSITDFFLPRL